MTNRWLIGAQLVLPSLVLAALVLPLLTLALQAAPAQARPICTVIMRADSGERLVEDGDCTSRVTPASTFKIALSLMGFDAGILTGPHAPVWPYRPGYVAWGGAAWTQDTDPDRWMTHSVVWYSQQITRALGMERLQRYATAFRYGNADMSGDAGADNGLDRAWIGSSLTISPREQVAFLADLVKGRLPVSAEAHAMTRRLLERTSPGDGWTIAGKTGAALPRRPDGGLDRGRGWGWYVGWARRGDETLVFATLAQDDPAEAGGPATGSPGKRRRDAFLQAWPTLIAGRP
ncbi:class D beta-lactamase (plasmid) [Tistrella bauzanensis]|uniref:class D beta-lactamase n=1 Tax=Tistrella TaxID=171436 RepID=UPI0031F6C0AE